MEEETADFGPSKGHSRTPEQIRQHYEIERRLADTLRSASRDKRKSLYSLLYAELFRRVPLHPHLTAKSSPAEFSANVASQLEVISPFLRPGVTFLEIGAGDCSLSFEVATKVSRVYAIDVTDELSRGLHPPENFLFLLSDGCSIPLQPGTVNLAYSNQLIEHLHPDDAFEQLMNIYQVLTPGGAYICITPHRFRGPHDISKHFDTVATGFHLQEYTVSELRKLFRDVGFSRTMVSAGPQGHLHTLPVLPSIFCEQLLARLPHRHRKAIAGAIPFRWLLGFRLIGIK